MIAPPAHSERTVAPPRGNCSTRRKRRSALFKHKQAAHCCPSRAATARTVAPWAPPRGNCSTHRGGALEQARGGWDDIDAGEARGDGPARSTKSGPAQMGFGRISVPVSSRRRRQTALKCSYRGDSVTRGLSFGVKSARRFLVSWYAGRAAARAQARLVQDGAAERRDHVRAVEQALAAPRPDHVRVRAAPGQACDTRIVFGAGIQPPFLLALAQRLLLSAPCHSDTVARA